MRIPLLLFTLLLFSLSSFSQEVFKSIDNSTYLFIGGVDGAKIKVLNTKDSNIEWVNLDSLEQTNSLKPDDFVKKIFDNGLYFQVDGSDTNWSAELRKDTLISYDPYKDQEYKSPVTITVKKLGKDSSFSIMFQSADKTVFGLIRSLGFSRTDLQICNEICDENSVFEIFINHKGSLFKGCVILTKD
jgi:hypothetical protein